MKIEGIEVRDARRPLIVTITHQDVASGRTKKPTSCAAAKACLRETKCAKVRVHVGRTYLMRGDYWERYITPGSVRNEIIAFDRGAKFAEGEYRFVAPKGRQKLGSGASGTNTGRNRPKHKQKKRAPYHVVQGVRNYADKHST